MESYKKDFVLFLAKNNCILRDKMLKSGRISPIYFHFGGELYTGKNISELAEYYANTLAASFTIDEKTVLFGPAMKGIPLVTKTAGAYYKLFGKDVRFAYNRQIEKDHGEGGLLCGILREKDKVIILDDVFTTGETKKKMKNLLLENVSGISLAGIVIGIDRKEMDDLGYNRVELFSHETNIPVYSIVTIDDVLQVLEDEHVLSDDWKKDIQKYRAEHGC